MRRVQLQVAGFTPLLTDAMSDEVLTGLTTGARPQIKKDMPFPDIARTKIYRENGEDGAIGLPATMLYASLVEAGRDVPFKGKKMISTKDSTRLTPMFFHIHEEFLAFPVPEGKEETLWVVDRRRGQLDSGGKKTAVALIRPKFPEWGFTVTVDYDEKVFTESTIQKLFFEAGANQGLGSFRPNCRGTFGCFRVAKWTDITPDEWTQAASGEKAASNGNGEIDEAKPTNRLKKAVDGVVVS
jgi:hypothetical protein